MGLCRRRGKRWGEGGVAPKGAWRFYGAVGSKWFRPRLREGWVRGQSERNLELPRIPPLPRWAHSGFALAGARAGFVGEAKAVWDRPAFPPLPRWAHSGFALAGARAGFVGKAKAVWDRPAFPPLPRWVQSDFALAGAR